MLGVYRNSVGLTSETSVVVRVVDANDHAPVFNEPLYQGQVRENAPPGTVLTHTHDKQPLILQATDKDSGTLIFAETGFSQPTCLFSRG